jgi:transcriptional regulator with XRE-family HTH domain
MESFERTHSPDKHVDGLMTDPLAVPTAAQAPGPRKAKTSLRIKYEAEVAVIVKRHGSLEQIRMALGLSQRKISQLLMVDPSAWTRWTKDGEKAPPHIYRSLQWYLNLSQRAPALDASFWLWSVANSSRGALPAAENDIRKNLKSPAAGKTRYLYFGILIGAAIASILFLAIRFF